MRNKIYVGILAILVIAVTAPLWIEAQQRIFVNPIIRGQMEFDDGALLEFAGDSLVPATDSEEDFGTAFFAWLHVYGDTIVVNERLDPDADGGADIGASALAFLQGYIDSLFAEHAEFNDLVQLMGDTSYVDGGAGLAGTASFTTTDLLDTVAFNSAAAVDGNSIFVVSFNTTTPDTNEVISWTAKADTLFVHRTAGATGATSGITYSYIRIQ